MPQRIEIYILTAGAEVDLREGTAFLSRNYLDNSLRVWIRRSQGNEKIAGLLCIKMRQNEGGD